jgi:hypothetical protein
MMHATQRILLRAESSVEGQGARTEVLFSGVWQKHVVRHCVSVTAHGVAIGRR